MFAPSRIRGPYGTHVTAELALNTGRALTAAHEQVVVGHNSSDNGRLLADAVAMGVRECGGVVHRLGTATSPTISNAVRRVKSGIGVSVTAASSSSKEVEFKLFDSDGSRLSWERQRRLVRIVNGATENVASWDDIGEERYWDDATGHHTEWLCEGRPSFDDTRVVVDIGGSSDVAESLERLGCDVDRITETSDDVFPHRRITSAEDICETLCRTVATSDADFGVAHDADSNRIVAVDEKGSVIGGDALLALFARDAVEDANGDVTVAVPLESSRKIEEVVVDAGGSLVRTKGDESPGSRPGPNTDIVFCGDPRGVHHWPDESPCSDASLSSIHLARLVEEGPTLSSQVREVAAYSLHFDSFSVDSATREMSRIVAEARDRFGEVQIEGGVIGERDDAWFVVRPSRTKREIRVTVEATSKQRAEILFEQVRTLVTAPESPVVV